MKLKPGRKLKSTLLSMKKRLISSHLDACNWCSASYKKTPIPIQNLSNEFSRHREHTWIDNHTHTHMNSSSDLETTSNAVQVESHQVFPARVTDTDSGNTQPLAHDDSLPPNSRPSHHSSAQSIHTNTTSLHDSDNVDDITNDDIINGNSLANGNLKATQGQQHFLSIDNDDNDNDDNDDNDNGDNDDNDNGNLLEAPPADSDQGNGLSRPSVDAPPVDINGINNNNRWSRWNAEEEENLFRFILDNTENHFVLPVFEYDSVPLQRSELDG